LGCCIPNTAHVSRPPSSQAPPQHNIPLSACSPRSEQLWGSQADRSGGAMQVQRAAHRHGRKRVGGRATRRAVRIWRAQLLARRHRLESHLRAGAPWCGDATMGWHHRSVRLPKCCRLGRHEMTVCTSSAWPRQPPCCQAAAPQLTLRGPLGPEGKAAPTAHRRPARPRTLPQRRGGQPDLANLDKGVRRRPDCRAERGVRPRHGARACSGGGGGRGQTAPRGGARRLGPRPNARMQPGAEADLGGAGWDWGRVGRNGAPRARGRARARCAPGTYGYRRTARTTLPRPCRPARTWTARARSRARRARRRRSPG